MRIITIVLFVILGFAIISIAQEQQWDRSQWRRTPERSDDRSSNSSDRPPWEQSSDRSDSRPPRSSDEGRPPWDGRQPPLGNGPPPTVQRGEFSQGGFPQGRFPQGPPTDRGGGSDRTSRMMDMFRSMDTNRNGILEPTEISETRRGFVSAIAARMGADPSRPINLADLERRAAAPRDSSSRSNDGNRNRSERDRPRSTTVTTTEPLVPPFGEQKPAETPVLAFGQREVLTPIPVNPTAAGTTPNQPAPAVTQMGRQSTPYGNISAEVRENTSLDWFFSYDKDADGQLSMLEYVNGYGGSWTPVIASEFRFLDRNGDGYATIDEVLLTLKEVDEQRAAEAVKETEQNRPVPESPGSSPPKPAQPGGQSQTPAAGGTSPPNIVPVSANNAAVNSGVYSSNRQREDSRRNRRNYPRSGQ